MGEELGLTDQLKATYSRSGRTGVCGRSGPSGSSENSTEFDTCIWSVYEQLFEALHRRWGPSDPTTQGQNGKDKQGHASAFMCVKNRGKS